MGMIFLIKFVFKSFEVMVVIVVGLKFVVLVILMCVIFLVEWIEFKILSCLVLCWLLFEFMCLIIIFYFLKLRIIVFVFC